MSSPHAIGPGPEPTHSAFLLNGLISGKAWLRDLLSGLVRWHAVVCLRTPGLVDCTWFFLLLSGWGVLLGWVYINTRSSLLLCVLYHAAGNTMTSAVLPFGGHDNLMMLVTALTWVVVIIVAIIAGPAHLSSTQLVERIQ